MLLAAAVPAQADALAVGVLGIGLGSAAHAISHVARRDLGGTPDVDIPSFAGLAVLLLAAGLMRWREWRAGP